MSSLVVCYCAFFGFRNNLVLLLQSADYAVNGIEKVLLVDFLLVVSCCDEGSLVAYVGDVGTAETRCLLGKEVDFYARSHLEVLGVDLENLFAFLYIGKF